ncbi:MAG: efflux transporter outer membrane subunit [Tidjanibacter sp.]|nr:efflux transporter outer membrane subunit [Tidjanibacter sp.]
MKRPLFNLRTTIATGAVATSIAFLLALLSVGCAVTPPVIEPVATPDEYIFAQEGDTTLVVGVGWWEIFGDTTLNRLVAIAVENNSDVRVAASRLLQARSSLTATKGSLLPSLGVGLGAQATYSEGSDGRKSIGQQYSLLPTISWEVELFGGISGATEAARADVLATEWGYRATMLALQAEVAQAYFQWLQYARSEEICRRSLALREESQARVDSLYLYGFASGSDRQQARALTATIAADIQSYSRSKLQANISLCTLLGVEPMLLPPPPHSKECAHSRAANLDGLYCGHLTAAPLPVSVSAGLPSALLERRPDVMESFYRVEAAAAKTKVAHARRLPSFALTAEGGVLAYSLKGLTAHNPLYWLASANLTQPLLNFGQLRAEEEVAVEAWRQAALDYRQSVIEALAEVENALIAIDTYNLQAAETLRLLEANAKVQQMTAALQADGMVSYFNYVDAEYDLYSSQLGYVQLMAEQLSAYVSLYKALGGGW